MGINQRSRQRLVVREARQAMDQFKSEIANEVGVANQIEGGYWGNISSRDCGTVGGNMTRRMVEEYERNIANRSSSK